MKNNFLFLVVLTIVSASFVGCDPIEDVDIDALADNMVQASFEKTPLRSKTVFDGLTTSITEWTITDASQCQITCNKLIIGNGQYQKQEPVTYVYSKLDKVATGLGYNFLFTDPQGDTLHVLYWGNSLVVKGDTIGSLAATLANAESIMGSFPNHKWEFVEQSYTILYDSTYVPDTIINSKVAKDPITGGKIIIRDTIISQKLVVDADTIGLNYYHKSVYNFRHNLTTFANTGSVYEYEANYKLNTDSTAMIPDGELKESTVSFNWGFNSITSASRFALNIESEGKLPNTLSISGLNISKGVLIVGGTNTYSLMDE